MATSTQSALRPERLPQVNERWGGVTIIEIVDPAQPGENPGDVTDAVVRVRGGRTGTIMDRFYPVTWV